MASARRFFTGAIALSGTAFSGVILAATGDPVADVDVSLERKPGRLIRQVRTDPQGNFSFGYVQEGDYVITIASGAPPGPPPLRTSGKSTASGPPPGTASQSRQGPTGAGAIGHRRFQVIVNGANAAADTRAPGSDGEGQVHVSTSGGQLGGRIVAR